MQKIHMEQYERQANVIHPVKKGIVWYITYSTTVLETLISHVDMLGFDNQPIRFFVANKIINE